MSFTLEGRNYDLKYTVFLFEKHSCGIKEPMNYQIAIVFQQYITFLFEEEFPLETWIKCRWGDCAFSFTYVLSALLGISIQTSVFHAPRDQGVKFTSEMQNLRLLQRQLLPWMQKNLGVSKLYLREMSAVKVIYSVQKGIYDNIYI